jgi:2-keto-4-pentenoate hydratase/2-oxohepta-3-ene-1,7-dioic acid hydratase in catechol pathway
MRVGTVAAGGQVLWGLIDAENNQVISGMAVAPTLRAYLAAGGTATGLRDLAGSVIPLSDLSWLPPIPDPSKIWCVGLNFDDYRRQLGLDFLKAPNIFLKAPSALTGHDSTVGVPSGYGTVFHEWELTAVVGRRLRGASPEEAAAAIFGYTILHDLTFHEIELVNRDHQQWAKNVDGFAPCGPWVVTADEIDFTAPLTMRRWRNGRMEAESSTEEMRHQLPELLSFISTFSTLEPGDLVTAGTPPAGPCGAGDVIEGDIEGIGLLRAHLIEREVDTRWQTVIT